MVLPFEKHILIHDLTVEDATPETIIQVDLMTSVEISRDDRWIVVNTRSNGIHLWVPHARAHTHTHEACGEPN